jgi:tight adherence protein B
MILFIALLAGGGVFAVLAGGAMLLTGDARVSSRVRQFVASDAPPTPVEVNRYQKNRRTELFAQLDERWNKGKPDDALTDVMERADIHMTRTEFLFLRIGLIIVLFLILTLADVDLWFVWWIPAAIVGWIVPRWWLGYMAARRLKKLDRQLPDILNIVAGSVRTGSSLFQALDRVAKEAEEPSRSEYLRVVRSMSLGSTLETALNNLLERIPTEDVEMLVTAITIQQQTGGNLSQILDLIATTVRERHRILREIEVLSAQQRLSAVLLAALPIGMTAMLFLINPNYIGRIFVPGPILCLPIAVVVLLVIGFIVMNRIAAIEV